MQNIPPENPNAFSDNPTKYAGFWLRVYAGLIDLAFFALLALPAISFYNVEDLNPTESTWMPLGYWDFFFSYVLPLLLTLAFWRFFGATPGKLLTSIKIIDDRGTDKLSITQSLIRYFSTVLSVLALGLGVLWIAVDKRKQSWHDVLAKTVVIKKTSISATIGRVLSLPILLIMLIVFSIFAYQFSTQMLMPTLKQSYCQGNVCVDVEDRLVEASKLYSEAVNYVERNFQPLTSAPNIIFCAKQDCLSGFNDLTHKGDLHAIAYTGHTQGIVIGSDPEAWSQQIVRHEMIHHLQAENLSIITFSLLPEWYLEGMASSFSGASREQQHPTYVDYRDQFEQWLETIDKTQFWQESRKLASMQNLLNKL